MFGILGQPNHKHIADAEGNPIISDINSMSIFAVFVSSLVCIGIVLYLLVGDVLSMMLRFGVSTLLSVLISIFFAKLLAKKAAGRRQSNETLNRSLVEEFEQKQIEERRNRAEKSGKSRK